MRSKSSVVKSYLKEQDIGAVPADEEVLLMKLSETMISGSQQGRRVQVHETLAPSSMDKNTYTVRAVAQPAIARLCSGLVVLNVRCAVDA